MGAFESGQTFLAGVIAKLPAELQAQAKELFEKPEAKDAVIIVGDGALARPDYSKAMDGIKTKETELTAKFTELNTWYEANKAALDEYKTMKPEYDRLKAGGNGDPDPDPDRKPIDVQKVVDETLTTRERDYAGFVMFAQTLAAKHYQMFGEVLDGNALMSNPKLGKPIAGQPGRVFSLQDAYNESFGERVQQKVKEAEDKRINDEVEKRMAEERKKLIAQPFPIRDATPSVLDTFATKEGSAAHTVDTAVAEYERLQSTRAGGS